MYDALVAQVPGAFGDRLRGRMRSERPWRRRPVDILRAPDVFRLVRDLKPAEIYYLAAFQGDSSTARLPDDVELFRRSYEVHVAGVVHFLEAIRRFSPATRLFYAASSHVFGRPKARVQDERAPIDPTSVYGITKAAGLQACRLYRRRYGVFASVGVLYSHAHRPGVRLEQDHTGLRGDPARPAQETRLGRSGRQGRLGLRARFRRRDAGHPETRRSRGFHRGHRPRAFGAPVRADRVVAGGSRLAFARNGRSAAHDPREIDARRRSAQAHAPHRLAAERHVRKDDSKSFCTTKESLTRRESAATMALEPENAFSPQIRLRTPAR